MSETVLETERDASRSAVADELRSIADQLEAGDELRIESDGRTASVAVADALSFALELERTEEDDRPTLELEIELEWETPDDAEAAASESAGSDASIADETDDEPDRDAAGTAPSATEDEMPKPVDAEALESLGQFQLFRDRADEWRWRLVHRNGNVIATSGEGYTARHNAVKGMRSVMRNAPDADVTDAD